MWVSTLQYICLCQQAFSNSEDQTHKVTIQETKLAHTDQSLQCLLAEEISKNVFLGRYFCPALEKRQLKKGENESWAIENYAKVEFKKRLFLLKTLVVQMSVQNTHWAVMPPVFFLDQALLSGFYESHVASAYWNRLLLTELKRDMATVFSIRLTVNINMSQNKVKLNRKWQLNLA